MTILDFQALYHNTDSIICVTIICESPNKEIINSLLNQDIILYVFDESPYFKHSYTNPTPDHIHYYVNEKLLKHFDISNEYLWKHIPKVIRLLKAERIVISQYQSPDLLEVGFILAYSNNSVFLVKVIKRILLFLLLLQLS